jgi:hypothetical protein
MCTHFKTPPHPQAHTSIANTPTLLTCAEQFDSQVESQGISHGKQPGGKELQLISFPVMTAAVAAVAAAGVAAASSAQWLISHTQTAESLLYCPAPHTSTTTQDIHMHTRHTLQPPNMHTQHTCRPRPGVLAAPWSPPLQWTAPGTLTWQQSHQHHLQQQQQQ